MAADPGRGLPSKGIVKKLMEVSQRFSDVDDWELSEKTHEFAEWSKHPVGGSHLIPWQDILTAQGKEDIIPAVERDQAAGRVFDDVFGPEP